MRFKLKDSYGEINPRSLFWMHQDIVQRQEKTLPFSVNRMLPLALQRTKHFFSAFYYHYNPLAEGLKMHRHRELTQPVYTRIAIVGIAVFVVVNAAFLFETKLWMERKWDEEPGCRIPMRHRHSNQLFNLVVNYWLRPNLMYYGVLMEDKDLDPAVDAKQIGGGRHFRRFLVADYIRKQKLLKIRDSRYDFLELSPEHGKL
jgi:hypothetical protein